MSLNTKQSAAVAKRYIGDFAAETRRMSSQMPVYHWVIMEVIAVFFLAVGFTRQRLTSAFCCAVLGTVFIFAGMILLLLYKGAAPVSRICQNQLFYQGIFGVMTAFGMAEQLLLCQRIKDRLTGKREIVKTGKSLRKRRPGEIDSRDTVLQKSRKTRTFAAESFCDNQSQ